MIEMLVSLESNHIVRLGRFPAAFQSSIMKSKCPAAARQQCLSDRRLPAADDGKSRPACREPIGFRRQT